MLFLSLNLFYHLVFYGQLLKLMGLSKFYICRITKAQIELSDNSLKVNAAVGSAVQFERLKPDKAPEKMPESVEIIDSKLFTALKTCKNVTFLSKRYSLWRITIPSVDNHV
jgi:hypothetical protein